MEEGSILTAILLGVAGSFVASIVFLVALFLIRPRIRIAEQICIAEVETDDENGKRVTLPAYRIKIVNRTWFDLFDVKASLLLVQPFPNGNNTNIRVDAIELKINKSDHIKSVFTGKENAQFAVIFNTLKNIDQIWVNKNHYLEFRVIATHGLSGFRRVFVKHFRDKSVHLVSGSYEYGKSTKVRI